jgi:hypothetical protein
MEIVAHATARNPVGATTPSVAAREGQVVRSLFRLARKLAELLVENLKYVPIH